VGLADKVWLEAVGREPGENSPWYRSHVLAQRPKLASATLIPQEWLNLAGMVQTQVTAQGCLGSTPEGRRPQIRGWRAEGSLAVASSTPATPLLSPAKIRELNHA